MAEEVELRAATGFVEPAVGDEFPGLRLDWLSVSSRRPRESPREVKRRLRSLSNRYRGASVVAMRTQPIPNAYRTFFRQIGLDPDTDRIPSEAAAVARLLRGGFEPSTLIDDARLIALVETGIPLWALDAAFVDAGGLGIRTSVAGERLGPEQALAPGRLVVADAASIHAVLFGDVGADHAVRPHTQHIVLYAVSVDGVPAIHVEEALWVCLEVLRSRGP